ncbi:piggyBac transposable element-derived protein 3-like [Schistocerca americana]|uniref:piggyBac transposable element-derived protein 3-like n=1 Tax=Schistocerca americana TaxID=7009 RepID=UPI001F4FEFD6|nr:piggyBac transposable element-derived protein 3-like [Schistocerca americana]
MEVSVPDVESYCTSREKEASVGADKINRGETNDESTANNESGVCSDNDNNDSDIQDSDPLTNNELSDGASTEFQTSLLKEFGQGPTVVLQLAQRIKNQIGHKIYFDNFFSSYKLFQALKQEKICAAGTVRVNRSANPPLIPDKEFYWKGEIDKGERWDKKESKDVTNDRPEIVKCYNHGMGGVDLFDQLMSHYRIFIKSKKWTLRAIFHAVGFAVVLSWLEYRKSVNAVGLPTKKIRDLLHFRMELADALVLSGMDTSKRKRGRPSATPPDTPVQIQRGETGPPEEIQYDGTQHLPLHESGALPTRCKFPR